jgi:hypothetical protein
MSDSNVERDPEPGNTGPVDPEMVKRAREAAATRDNPRTPPEVPPDGIDPDAPARGVLFPGDDDIPEPNEPG